MCPTLLPMSEDDLRERYGRQHTVRVADHVWAEATARAKRQNKRDRVSQVVREFLDWYTEQPGARMPRRPTDD